jgi:hypothetical protein
MKKLSLLLLSLILIPTMVLAGACATLSNGSDRVVVKSNSQEAQQYFGNNYTLEKNTSGLLGGRTGGVSYFTELVDVFPHSYVSQANKCVVVNPGQTGLTFGACGSGGSVTLPQDLYATSSPTFAGVTVGSLNGYCKASSGVLSATTSIPYGALTGTPSIPTYTASGTLLQLVAGAFSVKEGTLTNNKGCIYVTGTGLVCNTDIFTLASLSVSAPLVYNNTTGAFTITQASSTANGYLSSTDWSTFNGKQAALGFTAVPNTLTVAGKALSGNITLALDDLSDVVVATPATDQILKYNGTNWVNGAQTTVNGGSGVDEFYVDTASDIGGYSVLNKTPDAGAEVDEQVTCNNNTVLIDSYASPAGGLGGTQIDAGVWTFDTWAYASLLTLESHIKFDVYRRTATSTEVLLFTVNTPTINTASLATVALYSVNSVQQAFPINATDRLVVKVSGVTSNITNTVVHFIHGGTTHYSHFNIPLVVRHNDLAGLQGGTSSEYYHLTSAEYTALSGLSNSQLVGTDVSGNLMSLDTATYPSLTELSYVKGVTSGIQSQINAKGAGTVTAVSVATANGVSGSSSGGATPALTISLGAITPTTVNSTYIKTINGNMGVLGGFDSPGISNSYTENTVLGYVAGNSIAGNYNTILGSRSGYSITGANNITLGASAGKYETGSNAFYVDSRDRTNTAGDKAGAILYGVMSNTPSSQTLKTNSAFEATYGMNIPTGQTYKINGVDQLALKAPLTSPTFATSINGSYLTASELIGADVSKNLVSLPVATYPSLTELSYVKGLTSAIQTQLNGKQATLTNPITGTGTTNELSYWASASTQGTLPVATYPSLTELSYVKGLTSAIQTQLNAKGAGTVTGTGTTNELSYWSSATAQGTLAVATYPSLTELSYVKGLTSAVQTQLNGKQASGTYSTDIHSNITALNAVTNTNTGDNATNSQYSSDYRAANFVAGTNYVATTSGNWLGTWQGNSPSGLFASSTFTGNIGIGTSTPISRLTVNGDITFSSSTQGIVLTSPNGTRYRFTADDNGNLETDSGPLTLGASRELVGSGQYYIDVQAEINDYFKNISIWEKIKLFIKSLFI